MTYHKRGLAEGEQLIELSRPSSRRTAS